MLIKNGRGDVETLFRLFVSLKISAAEQLQPYLQSLNPDNENPPLAQQIIDQIVAADPLRYETYASIRSEHSSTEIADWAQKMSPDAPSFQADLGYFMAHWVTLERFLREALMNLLRIAIGLDTSGIEVILVPGSTTFPSLRW
jgi:hypothetical protein